MKKITVLLLAVCLLLTFTACTNNNLSAGQEHSNVLESISSSYTDPVSSASSSLTSCKPKKSISTDSTTTTVTRLSISRTDNTIADTTRTIVTRVKESDEMYCYIWDAYEDVVRTIRNKAALNDLFTVDKTAVIADMPMFLTDKFYVLPFGNANFYPHCSLDSRGYSRFLVLLDDGCDECTGNETIEIIIRHDKSPIAIHDSAWVEWDAYTTTGGLEIVPYHKGSRNGRFCVTKAYGYAISLDVSTYCDCAQTVIDTLSFKKVEIK